jgi:tetratricopeptide (TPR) repeat protein
MEFKTISKTSVPRALALCERYRLLNEPDQAESICLDILAADPHNQDAKRMLLLALTEQFAHKRSDVFQEAQRVAEEMTNPYERTYFLGIVFERWGRRKLDESTPAYLAGDWLKKAMALYEEAEKIKPADDDSALLRWNTCARLLKRVPQAIAESAVHEMHFGD